MIEVEDLEEEVLEDKEDLAIGIVIINAASFVSPLVLKLLVFLVALVASSTASVFALI
jgi:hypothetical protein